METKTLEARVGLTPSATKSFIQQGHRVLVEANAGAGSGFRDQQYLDAGCEIVTSASDVYGQSEMIVKVSLL
jgi:alanine dehydrogenase